MKSGFYSLNHCCVWLHTHPARPSRCVKVSVCAKNPSCMTFLGVCKLKCCITISFLYVLCSYVLENVSIHQFGSFGQTWYKILSSIETLRLINLKLCTDTSAIEWPKSKLRLNCNNTLWPFSCISKMMKKNNVFLFELLSFTRSNVLYSTTFILNFHKVQSVSFQMVSRICISLLQVLSYRQLDLGMSF